MTDNIIFISGIGTNVGKSYATGWLANLLMAQGNNVMTQKLIQTGNIDISEDITIHRRIMKQEYNEYDEKHITAPAIFSYPASPHLAATIDHTVIDFYEIEKATNTLSSMYDMVLVEGAGGLMVPLTENYLTIDYIKDHNYPVALVTNGSLGAINHTLLSFEALKARGILLPYVIYNSFFDENEIIAADNKKYMMNYFEAQSPQTKFLVMPQLYI